MLACILASASADELTGSEVLEAWAQSRDRLRSIQYRANVQFEVIDSERFERWSEGKDDRFESRLSQPHRLEVAIQEDRSYCHSFRFVDMHRWVSGISAVTFLPDRSAAEFNVLRVRSSPKALDGFNIFTRFDPILGPESFRSTLLLDDWRANPERFQFNRVGGNSQRIEFNLTPRHEDGSPATRFWRIVLDPSKGYSVVRESEHLAPGAILRDRHVEEFFRSGDLWYPRRAYVDQYAKLSSPDASGVRYFPVYRYVIEIEVSRLNEPLPADWFEVSLPPGTRLHDRATDSHEEVQSMDHGVRLAAEFFASAFAKRPTDVDGRQTDLEAPVLDDAALQDFLDHVLTPGRLVLALCLLLVPAFAGAFWIQYRSSVGPGRSSKPGDSDS